MTLPEAEARLPALIESSRSGTRQAFLEFFAAQIRNAHTRKAYSRATIDFLSWCDDRRIASLNHLTPLHISEWLADLEARLSLATTKQYLAAIRMLLDWMASQRVLDGNPAQYVKGPRYSQRRGKTPVIDAADVRSLFDSIGDSKLIDLRDRALIGLMVYTFARIGAALAMNVGDVFTQNRRLWVRLLEKGGKLHEMPCHHSLEEWLSAYIDSAKLTDSEGPLFRAVDRRRAGLTEHRLQHANAFEMVRRRSRAAGLQNVCCHSFRATGITAYLVNGGTIERAAAMANHASIRTTQLYDRRDDALTLDEVERIAF